LFFFIVYDVDIV